MISSFRTSLRSLSKWNVTVKKWPDIAPGIGDESCRSNPGRFLGHAYIPLNPVAKWMIWMSTIVVVVLAFLVKGAGTFPYFAIGVPGALALAVMIARMGNREWHLVVGLLYVLGMMFVLFALPG